MEQFLNKILWSMNIAMVVTLVVTIIFKILMWTMVFLSQNPKIELAAHALIFVSIFGFIYGKFSNP